MNDSQTIQDIELLKLRAEDEEDLQVLAACLQDALAPLSEMRYSAADERFTMVVNRFRWEACCDEVHANKDYERVLCAVDFGGVKNVQLRGINQEQDQEKILDLLTIAFEPQAITLLFAGGTAIRLSVKEITCLMSDLNDPWPTKTCPGHDGA